MKKEDLLHAMNDIDSSYIQDAQKADRKTGRRKFLSAGIAAACLCLVVGAGLLVYGTARADRQDGEPAAPTLPLSKDPQKNPGGDLQADSAYADYAIVQASYPECAPYPDAEKFGDASQGADDYKTMWANWSKQRERIGQSEAYRDGLYPYYGATMKEFLVSDEKVNRTYSPLNLYMALSMLAEMTKGNSRAQILELLGVPDIAAVRERASALWIANYSDDGMVSSILANSLWLRQGDEFNPGTMQTLADTYHASSFCGEMGSEEFTQAFRAWMNAQTGGLLEEQVEGLSLEPEMVLALVSTIYYRAQWQDIFLEENTREDIFHKADGDITCDFMHQEKYGVCYQGENFSAIRLSLEHSGDMWLFLPDETADVNDVAAGDDLLKLLRSGGDWENRVSATINLAMPKFDVVSEINLIDGLKAMGVTDVFDEYAADFGSLKEDADGLYVSEAKHAARVSVDEKGCTAAAYTMMAINESGYFEPPEEIDFVLDRPFLFALTGADGTLLFTGVVEEP